ncbi:MULTISPECIES: antitoxin [Streptomyces]|uniref:Collagen triple helix repeat-containing protein n=1 Tax=Streptomyces katrae TaxID=68223 RepID=A0A0F4J6W4_9ACTN|nr:antitoxin [Streptomyces katrae]KJY28671.1 collagen triple helix repeat-containing protein [Streptomyces katrae]
MGLLDNLKAKLAPAKDKVGDLAQKHEGRIGEGLDKVAKVVDSKTHGKYSDRITSSTDKAKGALGKVAHKDAPGGPTPPAAS